MASKLATTLFGVELDRRLRAAGSPIISTIAHPGLSRSGFIDDAWKNRGGLAQLMGWVLSVVTTQPTEQGALNQLYAATAPDVNGGDFFGPSRRGEKRGQASTEAWTGVTYL